MHLPRTLPRDEATITDSTNRTILDLSTCTHDPETGITTGDCTERFGVPPSISTDSNSNNTPKGKLIYAAATGAVLLLAIGIALCVWFVWRRCFRARFAELRKKRKVMDGRGGERGREVELAGLGVVPSQASLAPLTQRV